MNILLDVFTDRITNPIILLLLLISEYIYDNDKDNNKESIVESIHYWIFIIITILNIAAMRYFSSHFNIKQLTCFLNPITGILLLSIINVLVALYIIQKKQKFYFIYP